MSNLFKKNRANSAKLGKHGHDLSNRLCFTSSVGHLLPVLYDVLNPGDTIDVQSDLFTRTQPLKTPAFVRLNEHIDYFFVPMKLIDSYFNNAFYGINDFSNPNDSVDGSLTTFTAPSKLPTQPMSFFRTYLLSNSGMIDGPVPGDPITTEITDEYSIPVCSNLSRLLSHLGYGEKVVTSGSLSSTQNKNDVAVNFYPFAVYQRIFSDYYRDSEFTPNEPYSYSLNAAYKENSAYYMDQINRLFDGDNRASLFKLHYHGLGRDYFTSFHNLPSFANNSSQINSYMNSAGSGSNVSDSSILSALGVNPEALLGNPSAVGQGGLEGYGNPANNQISVTIPSSGSPLGLNLSALRTAYAMDKMYRITNKAGKHYDRQTLAHFGFHVPQGVSDEVYFLGSHSQELQIGEVVSTATTGTGSDSSTLGELAGRGASRARGNSIRFTAPCHGFLMAIYSAVPDIQYSAFGVDAFNTFSHINQFYHPEFDRLGMAPVYYSNYFFDYHLSSKIIGWNYRYLEYKSRFDKVIGAFNYTLQDWVPTHNNTYLNSADYPNGFIDFIPAFKYCSPCYLDNIFAVSFKPVGSEGAETSYPWAIFGSSNILYEDPVNISPVFERDPLLHSLQFKYYKSSVMSPYGDPV